MLQGPSITAFFERLRPRLAAFWRDSERQRALASGLIDVAILLGYVAFGWWIYVVFETAVRGG